MGAKIPPGTLGKTTIANDSPGKWTAKSYTRDRLDRLRRIEASAPTKAAAQRAIAAKAIKVGAEGSRLGASPTVEELIREWLSNMAVLPKDALEKQDGFITSQTAKKNRTHAAHAIRVLGKHRVSELTTHAVEKGLNSLVIDGKGATTARCAKVVLKAALDDAVRLGFIESNPVLGARIIKPLKKPVVAPAELQIEEMWKILEARYAVKLRGIQPNPLLIPMLELMLETGTRIGEVTALSWGAVDLEGCTIRVEATMVEGDGPLRRQAWAKTSSSLRILHFSPEYAATLAGLYEQQGQPDAENPVFPAPLKGGHTAPSSIRKTMERIFAWAGCTKIPPHALRKAVATATEGVYGLEQTAKLLGHSDSRVTRQHYVQPSAVTANLTAATAGFRRKKPDGPGADAG